MTKPNAFLVCAFVDLLVIVALVLLGVPAPLPGIIAAAPAIALYARLTRTGESAADSTPERDR